MLTEVVVNVRVTVLLEALLATLCVVSQSSGAGSTCHWGVLCVHHHGLHVRQLEGDADAPVCHLFCFGINWLKFSVVPG